MKDSIATLPETLQSKRSTNDGNSDTGEDKFDVQQMSFYLSVMLEWNAKETKIIRNKHRQQNHIKYLF